MTASELLTPLQLANRLGLEKETILRWTKSKKIPVFRMSKKVLRYELSAVLDAIKKQNKKDESK